MSSGISSHFGLHGWKTVPGLETERLDIASFVAGSNKSLPQKVGSRVETYSRMKFMLVSDKPKDLVKNCVEGGGCMSSFQPLLYIRDLEYIDCQWVEKSTMWRFMWRKREFYWVIWRCSARVKCGSIMSGFRKCCDCRQSHLLCDLPKVLTGMWLSSCYQKTLCQA